MTLRNFACVLALSAAGVVSFAQTAQDLPDAPGMGGPAPAVPSGPTVIMDTSMGRLTCRFFGKQAPNTVANFIGLAKGTQDWVDPDTKIRQHNIPFYDGTTFHRVIPEFMVQGGDHMGTGEGDAGYYIRDEISPSLKFNVAGRLAMANSGPNTSSTQFFITELPQPDLDGGYTIFGQCDAASVALVAQIARVPRNADNKPLKAVTLKKVTIVLDGDPVPPDPMPTQPPAASAPAAPAPATPTAH